MAVGRAKLIGKQVYGGHGKHCYVVTGSQMYYCKQEPHLTKGGQFPFVAVFNWFDLFVLRFYGPVNPMGSCRARSVYLTTRLLGRLSPLSGSPVLCTFFRQKLTTALLESAEGRE